MKDNDVVEMEVFRTGDYGAKGAYTEHDLDTMAADYRADLLEAPLTFDHAQTGPAYGWVSALRREGDRLIAGIRGVPAAVIDLMKGGAYKRRSVELFRKLPNTGRPYLRAVSLLGAATPEVKGLREVCFASQQETSRVEFAVEEQTPTQPVEPAVRERRAAAMTAARVKLGEMFSALRQDGYCLPEADARSLENLVTFAHQESDGADGDASFSEESPAINEAVDCLSRLLRQALLKAPLGVQTKTAAPGGGYDHAAAPHFSERMEPRSFALHQAALRLMETEPSLAYRDALLRASR